LRHRSISDVGGATLSIGAVEASLQKTARRQREMLFIRLESGAKRQISGISAMPSGPKKQTRTFRLRTQHVKLRCLSCRGKCSMAESEYELRMNDTGRIRCCFIDHGIPCDGRMFKFGRRISRPRTVSMLPTYNWVRERAARGRRAAAIRAEEAFDPDHVEENEGTDDPDFVLNRDFFINMRFTPEDMDQIRTSPPDAGSLGALVAMTTGVVMTANADFAERMKSTKMYAAPGKSAWTYSLEQGAPNASRFRVGSLHHYEWCHLQGVCIGGKTQANNLVCGHFAVNTYMAVIEAAISSSGAARRVQVTAWCQLPHVANWIHYRIFHSLVPTLHDRATDIWIDGTITKFSQNDEAEVRGALRRNGIG